MVRVTALVCGALGWCACASAPPLLAGGSPVSLGHSEVSVGAAGRVAAGALSDLAKGEGEPPAGRSVAATGLAPAGAVRYAFGERADLGGVVAGTTARIDLRRWFPSFGERLTRGWWMTGASVLGGYVYDRDFDGGGWRVGAEVPLTFSVATAGVAEAWAGGRLGFELSRGAFSGLAADGDILSEQDVEAWMAHLGLVLGFAFGFDRVHAIVELTTRAERWSVQTGGRTEHVVGLAWIPAFALRLRP